VCVTRVYACLLPARPCLLLLVRAGAARWPASCEPYLYHLHRYRYGSGFDPEPFSTCCYFYLLLAACLR